MLKRPPDVHNPDAIPFKPEKPQTAEGADRQLADVRPQPGAHALPAGEGGQAAVPPDLALQREAAARVPAGLRSAASSTPSTTTAIAFALDADTGKVLWERRIGRLNASSPAYHQGPSLHRQPRPRPRRQARRQDRQGALETDSCPGAPSPRRWCSATPSTSAAKTAQLFALSTRNGNVRWATTLGGPVKSAPAFRDGVLYVGDYGGYMNAVDAGERQADLAERLARAGLRAPPAQFYSTPARRLRPRLRRQQRRPRLQLRPATTGRSPGPTRPAATSTPARPSPAPRRRPPTVYIGSFDGNIYALNAKNGETRWSHSAGGQVVGSLSAVGNIVYVAEFTHGSTNGYEMRTGRQVFHYKTGTYTPVISDGRRIYLVGYSSINALQPISRRALARPEGDGRRAPRRAAHHRRAHPLEDPQRHPNRAAASGSGSA